MEPPETRLQSLPSFVHAAELEQAASQKPSSTQSQRQSTSQYGASPKAPMSCPGSGVAKGKPEVEAPELLLEQSQLRISWAHAMHSAHSGRAASSHVLHWLELQEGQGAEASSRPSEQSKLQAGSLRQTSSQIPSPIQDVGQPGVQDEYKATALGAAMPDVVQSPASSEHSGVWQAVSQIPSPIHEIGQPGEQSTAVKVRQSPPSL